MDVDSEVENFIDSDEEQKSEDEDACDFSAYVLFQEGNAGSPCLSFDIVEDDLGNNRNCDEPVTCYFVCGTQASRTHLNNIILLKVSNICKIKEDDPNDEEDDDDESLVFSAKVNHEGCVNRIRTTNIDGKRLAASFSELGQVHIWDMQPMFESVSNSQKTFKSSDHSPLFTFNGHSTEGYAIDWAPSMPGTLATGDCSKCIYVWKPDEVGTWAVGAEHYAAHTASVEDIQWSPNEENVFASCSVDKSIRIWDARARPKKACMLTCENAHESDVNVIHWNRHEPFIASGGDDSKILVWDLRKFESKTPVATLQYHTKPVCSVAWHPSDSSVLASAGEDNKVLQWDLAVERDEAADKEAPDTPQQLLFVHEGQEEVKEIHWHNQIPGLMISTALSGFNILKTISC